MTSPPLLAPAAPHTPMNTATLLAPPVHPILSIPSMLQHASGICISARLQTALLPAPLSGPL